MAKITYLGHSSFLIESKNYQIVVDPYKDNSVPNLTFPRGLVVDKVFCSHSHFDHNAVELVKIKETPNPVNAIR
jgi:L-ascorbate metabolism protein UlaG (beta-lactamase superfamily)